MAASCRMVTGLETDAATRAFLLERLSALTPDTFA